MIEQRAGIVIGRADTVEHLMGLLDVEDALADQSGAIDLADGGDDAAIGIGHRMMGRERPDLAVADDAFGKDPHQHRLADQAAGRAGIIGARSIACAAAAGSNP